METQRGILMKHIKDLALVVVVALLVGAGFNWYYGNKMNKMDDRLREYRENTEQIITMQNEKIGEYTYSLAVQEDDLKDAHNLSELQRDTIDELQDDLKVKVDEVALLSVQLDSVMSEGVAEITIMPDNNEIVYEVHEHKNGYKLDLSLTHPSGDYIYVIKQDPLTMEIYLARENKTEYRVGSIRFPDNPNVLVTNWTILYDPETRPWYQRFWEDMHFDVGVFGGSDYGISTMVGYKRVTAGPVFTEGGLNLGAVYRIK
jgi:hypothetical protein